jgi:hypothetical protein
MIGSRGLLLIDAFIVASEENVFITISNHDIISKLNSLIYIDNTNKSFGIYA